MKVSFSGIYDVRFPYGTDNKYIKAKCKSADKFVKQQGHDNIIAVDFMDRFDCQKTDMRLADEGIRNSSSIDNPWILAEVFNSMDKNLPQQY